MIGVVLKISRGINYKKLLALNSPFWVFLLLLVITTIGALHVSYPDEFENILGGRYIIQGRLPYIGFFTHHNPFAYFFSAPIFLITGQSFVKFRLLLGAVYAVSMVVFYLSIKKRFGVVESLITLVWLIFVAVGATYWWGYMLLADTLSSYLVAVPVILLFWLIYHKENLKRSDLWVISILTALALLTTFTLLYLALFIYLSTLVLIFKNTPSKVFSRETIKVLGILAIPYVVFAIYLIVTGSIKEYFYQSVLFNVQYYAVLPGGASLRNPLRVVIVLFYQFFTNFKTMLVMTKDLNFGSPFAQTLALSSAVLVLYSIIERRFFLAAFIWLTLTFSIVRSNPYTTAETDYQGMAYHLISISNGIIALTLLWKALKNRTFDAKYLLYGGGFLFLAAYFFFFSLHLSEKYLEKAYQKYMGTQSLIYNRPSVANTLNQLLNNNDYYFLGPFDFENHLYINAKLASKYIVVIPAMYNSEKIQQEMLADLSAHQPKVIVYNTEMRIFGDKPGRFLKPFLEERYFTLEHLGAPCINYKASTKWFGDYDFERHFFFIKTSQDQLIAKLLADKLIAPVDPAAIPDFCRDRYRNLQIPNVVSTSASN